MRAIKTLVLLVVMQGLSACSTYSLEALRHTPPKGTPFQAQLAMRYLKFADEQAAAYDWIDSGYFAGKGLLSAYGKDVAPEELSRWNVPADTLPELAAARADLVMALTPRAIGEKPALAADAQYYFDCWVENRDDGWQWDEIAYCRDHFRQALAQLGANAATPEEDKSDVAPAEKQAYIVFFGMNRDGLDAQGEQIVDGVAEDLKQYGDTEYAVTVNGHTDTLGGKRYNLALSLRRAKAVMQALAERGVPRMLIRAFGFGKTDPNVPTADGVADPRNRRVEIYINGD